MLSRDIRLLMAHAGDTSNLILDPDLDSYYLMAAVVRDLPFALEKLASAAAGGPAAILASADVVSAADSVRRGLDVATGADPALGPRVGSRLAEANGRVLAFVDALRQGTAPDPAAAFAATFGLYDTCLAALDELLAARIDRFRRQQIVVGVVTALALLVVFTLSAIFYRGLMRAVRSLEEASRRIESGDMSGTVRIETRDEIGRVVRSFNRVASRLREESRQAREAEERQRLVIEGASDAIVVADTTGKICDWNPEAERIIGWPRAQAMGRDFFEVLFPADARAPHQATVQRYREGGDRAVLARWTATSLHHRDGRVFQGEISIAPVAPDGVQGWSGFMREVK